MTSNLPFTPDQFFEVFAEYNRSVWFFALTLWLHAVAGAIVLARHRDRGGRVLSCLLAVQWAWVAVVYHGAFFTSINPAAWLFAALFLIQSALFVWFGLVRNELRFDASGSPRGVVAWTLIVYALVYPMLAHVDGHPFPRGPTFGVPCPMTLLTMGFLFAAVPPWPRVLAVIPVLWAFVGGSAALVLGVRADLMLWVSGAALTAYVLLQARRSFLNSSVPSDAPGRRLERTRAR